MKFTGSSKDRRKLRRLAERVGQEIKKEIATESHSSTFELKPQKTGRWWKIPLAVLGALSGFLTIAEFILAIIIPKLSVDVSGSLQAANPMASVFYLSNNGSLSEHDVVAACGAVQFKAGRMEIESQQDARFVFPESKAKILSPGHQMTLPCAHLIGAADPSAITRAEMTIIADYRPDWVPWHKTARFPWKAEKTDSGTWVWKSVPQ